MFITDQESSSLLAKEWSAVRYQQERVRTYLTAGTCLGGWVMSDLRDNIYALLLPFGFSVLEHTLIIARDNGVFHCKSSQLGYLMVASRRSVAWRNFDAIETAKQHRNALAHEQLVPSSATTFQALNDIESELIGWKVLDGPVEYKFTLTVGGGT